MNRPDLELMRVGTAAFIETVESLPDLATPSGLPGWSRRHLVAHVAANALALRRLVDWARSGVENPMYASSQARAEEIDQGALAPDGLLQAALRGSSADLHADLLGLSEAQWDAVVRTAQGRRLPANQIPWLRCREVFIHRVDLDAGITFADLPDGFLRRLVDDVVAARSTRPGEPALRLRATDVDLNWQVGEPAADDEVCASLADLAAWLTGRAVPRADTTSHPLPPLPAWL